MIKRLAQLNHKQHLLSYIGSFDNVMRDFKDRVEFYAYQNDILKNLSLEKQMEMQVLSLLEKLGYPMEEIGTYFYKNVIVKVVNILKENSNEDDFLKRQRLRVEMKNAYSQFYFDIARNDLDIGLTTFHTFVIMALSKLDLSEVNIHTDYGSLNSDMDYGEQAYILGTYFLESEKLKKDVDKIKKLQVSSF